MLGDFLAKKYNGNFTLGLNDTPPGAAPRIPADVHAIKLAEDTVVAELAQWGVQPDAVARSSELAAHTRDACTQLICSGRAYAAPFGDVPSQDARPGAEESLRHWEEMQRGESARSAAIRVRFDDAELGEPVIFTVAHSPETPVSNLRPESSTLNPEP
jgi:glutamyl/glutaminyl-tRNA synthetase